MNETYAVSIGSARVVVTLPPIPVSSDFLNGDGYANYTLYTEALKAWKWAAGKLLDELFQPTFTGPGTFTEPDNSFSKERGIR
jgi:hypothetical protein